MSKKNSINIENISKKFTNEYIVKNLSYSFKLGSPTAIVGPNGSGKSTLVQVLTGILPPNSGKVEYFVDEKLLDEGNWYKHLNLVAPYIELVEELSLKEFLQFHSSLKPLTKNVVDLISILGFEKHTNKQLKHFSSGMKTRLKLGLAFYDDSDFLFLDEPCANLDKKSMDWYSESIQSLLNRKVVIVSSNDNFEYSFCENQINILNFKS